MVPACHFVAQSPKILIFVTEFSDSMLQLICEIFSGESASENLVVFDQLCWNRQN